jgi:hypothetical protein
VWCSWLRYCATSGKVAGSMPYDIAGIFHWCNPSGHSVAMGLTRLFTELSSMNISWGKGGQCLWLTTLPSSCADCLEICVP